MPLILIDVHADRFSVRSGEPDDVWDNAVALDVPGGSRALVGDRLGVRLEPDRDPSLLAIYLDRIDIVEIVMPVFTDGRGFSQARQLREMGYGGQIRASGDILIDQIAFLVRCGVDAVWFDPGKGEAVAMVRAALEEIPVVYQGVLDQCQSAAQVRASRRRPPDRR